MRCSSMKYSSRMMVHTYQDYAGRCGMAVLVRALENKTVAFNLIDV